MSHLSVNVMFDELAVEQRGFPTLIEAAEHLRKKIKDLKHMYVGNKRVKGNDGGDKSKENLNL